MRVLLDCDVLLDVGLRRMPWFHDSGAVFRLAQRRAVTGFVGWHSVANVHYIARRQDGVDARGFVAALIRFLEVAPVGHADMEFALEQDMTDLEDAMQAAAAVACRAARIVTRNTRHFKNSPVLAVTPKDFLASVGRGGEASET